MLIVEFLSQPLWQRLGLTLVHFLWQGLAVAVLVGALVRVVRLKHGNARYAAYLLAFIAMIACPVVTFTAIDIPISPDAELVIEAELPAVVDNVSYTVLPAGDILPEVETSSPVVPTVDDSIPWSQRISEWLNVSMPWVLVIWMVGVLVLSVRLLMGFVGVYRWRHHLQPLPERLAQRIASLSERLRMRRFSRVFISPTVLQAMAVGYLRPMVLLPAAMVTRMQPEMLEAVIAHELAHIRRLDLWVNLAQRVTETLLFYHPAVWWLSNCIRSERELCCDELAVKATGQRLTYATTLESVGRARFMPKPPVLAAGLGQDNKPTLGRVRHILGLAPAQRNCPFWLAGVIAVLFLAAIAVPTALALRNQSAEKLTDLESVVVEGIRANRDKFERGYLAWSSKQITTRFADSNRPATELAGEYELWWDAKKMATKYVRDQVYEGPEGNFRIEKVQGGNSYDGGVLSRKPRFRQDNWLGPYITCWRGRGSQDWLLEHNSKREGISRDWSVVETNGGKVIRFTAKNMIETDRSYGGYSITDYDPSKGYGLVNEEWYDPNGKPRLRHTVKMVQVIPGGWFPVEVDYKHFAIDDGKVYSRHDYALDIERCTFNDRSAFPGRVFKGAIDKQRKHQEKLQKYLEMELRGISGVKEADKGERLKRAAREAVETFIAAALAGDFQKARRFTDPNKAVADQVVDIPEMLKGQNLQVMAVVADNFDAIAVSSVVLGDHERIGPLVFFLDRRPDNGRDNWWVDDIDLETPDSAEVELKRFLEKHPKARKVPSENRPPVQIEGKKSLEDRGEEFRKQAREDLHQEMKKKNAREFAEAYVTALKNKDWNLAASMCRPGSKQARNAHLLGEMCDFNDTDIETVYANKKIALAVTEGLRQVDGRKWQLAFTLTKQEEGWIVKDIDWLPPGKETQEIENFRRAFPDAQIISKGKRVVQVEISKARLIKPEIIKTSDSRARLFYFSRYVDSRDLAKLVAEKIGFIADKDITRNEGKNQISIVCPTTGDAQTVLKFLQEVDAEPIQVRIDVRVVEAYPDVELDWETRVAARNITGAKTTSNAKREESLSAPDILRETAKAEPQPENSVEKLVDLLASRGYLKILMNPKIEVLDGKTARIQSSQRPPDGNEIVTSFEITPRILDDGSIGVAANMIYNNMQLGDPRTHINIKDGVSRLIGSVTKTEKHAIVRDGVKGLEQRTTEVLVILTPTIITPERNLSKKSAVQVEREEVWGEAVDGLQLRLRTEKLVWKSGKGPILKADVRNNGTKMKAVPMFPLGYLVEIDGVSYSDQVVRSHWASDTWNAQVRLAPGEERIGVEISLDEHTKYSKGDLRGALDPGKHIVRIGFPHDDLASKENQFFSNPVVIEILPEAKPDVQVEGEITKDLGGHKGLEFLAGIPEFRDLRLDMTERQLRLHIHLHSLAATFHEKGDETTYHLFTGEGENVFVMFRNGQCTGIQRMRLDRQTALKLFEEKRLSEPDAFSAYHKACRFLYEGGDRIEAAKRFREAAQLAPATKYGAWGRELAVLLVGMAKEQRPVVDKPLRSSFIITGDVSIVQNIEDLIFDLRDVAVQSMFVPGKCRVLRQMTIAPKSSTPNPAQRLKVLAKRGSGCDELVIPRLIKLLSDNRPTRSWAGEMNGGHVLRYCDLALEIIADAAEVKLPNETTTFDTRTTRDAYLGNADEGTRSEIISRVKAWWQKEKNNSDVQVDTKTAESAEKLDIESLLAKVRRALQPTDNMRVSWRFETVEPFEWGTTKSMHTVREYTATISGFKSRLEYLQKTYTSKASKEPYIIHRETYVFDGKQCRNLVEPVKGGNTTKIGWVKPQNVTAVLLYQELFAFVLPLHDEDKLNEYEFNLADSPSPGIYVVKIIGPEDGSPNQMTIDGRRGFNIINTQWFGPKNRKTLEDRTVLRQYDDGIWYPAERRRIRYYPNGTHKLEHIDKFSKLELDVKVPEDTFTLEFPPGTKTWDATLDDWVLISNSDSSGKKLAADGEGKN